MDTMQQGTYVDLITGDIRKYDIGLANGLLAVRLNVSTCNGSLVIDYMSPSYYIYRSFINRCKGAVLGLHEDHYKHIKDPHTVLLNQSMMFSPRNNQYLNVPDVTPISEFENHDIIMMFKRDPKATLSFSETSRKKKAYDILVSHIV